MGETYPHQLSGGQRQRAMIAMTLALEPSVLVSDEPTTALDVTTPARILALIRDLQRRRGMSVPFMTHGLCVAAAIRDRIAVTHRGAIIEMRPTADLFRTPEHPCTRSLLAAVPGARAETARDGALVPEDA